MRSGGPNDIPDSTREPADLTEVVRLYGIRHWIEQSYSDAEKRHQRALELFRAVGDRRHLVRPTGLSAVLTVVSGSLGMKLASDKRCNSDVGGY